MIEGAARPELIVNSTERIDAYDPTTGKLLWFTGEANRFPVPTPVADNGIIYASRGYRSGPYMAIRTGGSGDISATHLVWRVPTGAPYVASLLHYQGVVYMATDVGILTAVDAKTGERIWQQRVEGCSPRHPSQAAGTSISSARTETRLS